MHVVSHPEADQELEAAALWYEQRQAGLGTFIAVRITGYRANLRLRFYRQGD
jgi:hypothetical protein